MPTTRTTTTLVAAVLLTLTGCLPAALRPLDSGPTVVAADGTTLTADDGYVPDGESLSPFDSVPAISNLERTLLAAVQDAARDAEAAGLPFHVSSGWRSREYQQSLLDAAVVEYGDAATAREYVLDPDHSAHVSGRAVDIGPVDAMDWLSRHGTDYGLCQTYANEMWHFELATSRGGVCPDQLPDATAG